MSRIRSKSAFSAGRVLVVLFLLIFSPVKLSGQTFSLESGAVTSGGGVSRGGEFSLFGSIAQAASGAEMSGGDFSLQGGVFSVGGSPNEAPTISFIDNQNVLEDSAVILVPFVVADLDSDFADLTVFGLSSDSTIVSPDTFVFMGDEAARTLSMRPVEDAVGEVQISIVVSDGRAQSSAAFIVTVEGVNDPPSIQAIPDVGTSEDAGELDVAYQLSDVDHSSSDLAVAFLTSNSRLLPLDAIQNIGEGSSRILKLAPVRDQSGVAEITVTVTDGEFTASTVFTITVTGDDDPPSLEVEELLEMFEDTVVTVPLRVADPDTPVSDLSVSVEGGDSSLFPAGSIEILRIGDAVELRLTPSRNRFGDTALEIEVADAESSVSGRQLIRVIGVNDAPEISAISDLEVEEDADVPAVQFRVFDPDSDFTALEVTASSSNPSLVREEGLLVKAESLDQEVRIDLVPNASGISEIKVHVSDGDLVSEEIFNVVVNEVNDPPSIEGLEDLVLRANESSLVEFVLSDPDHPADRLVVDLASLDRELIPASDFPVDGTGLERSFLLAPAAGKTGTTSVLVGVSDGTELTVVSFEVKIVGDEIQPAIVTIERTLQGITISWDVPGVLEAAGAIEGPYTAIPGATSPYFIESNTLEELQFYRVVGDVGD